MRPKPTWHAEAIRLYAEGVTMSEIARHLGYHRSAVRRVIKPEATSLAEREQNLRGRARKREWDRAHPRTRISTARLEEPDPLIPGLLPVRFKTIILDFARVDLEDWEWMRHIRWGLNRTTQYAGGVFDGEFVYLHHLVLGVRVTRETGLHTDHINRDRLDNRRCNLRVVTPKENCANRGGAFEKLLAA